MKWFGKAVPRLLLTVVASVNVGFLTGCQAPDENMAESTENELSGDRR